jgi:Response regulator receiver domain
MGGSDFDCRERPCSRLTAPYQGNRLQVGRIDPQSIATSLVKAIAGMVQNCDICVLAIPLQFSNPLHPSCSSLANSKVKQGLWKTNWRRVGMSVLSRRWDNLQIVVVDDHKQVRSALGGFLSGLGAVVHECSNADRALELVVRLRPALVVSDIAMRDKDGFELLQFRIATLRKRTPVTLIHSDQRSEVYFGEFLF